MKTKDLEKGKAYAHTTMHSMENCCDKLVMEDPTAQYGLGRFCTDMEYVKKGDGSGISVRQYDRVLVRDPRTKKLRAVRPRDNRKLWSVHQQELKARRDRAAEEKKTREAQKKAEGAQYRKIRRALKVFGYEEHEDFHEEYKYGHTMIFFSLEAMNRLLGIES